MMKTYICTKCGRAVPTSWCPYCKKYINEKGSPLSTHCPGCGSDPEGPHAYLCPVFEFMYEHRIHGGTGDFDFAVQSIHGEAKC